MSDKLFADDPITNAFTGQRGKALAYVDGMHADTLLASPLDDLVERVMRDHRMRPLVIEWDRKTVDATEVEVELDAGGKAAGTRVTYFVPYSGSAGLFHLRPTPHGGEPPSAIVRSRELLLSYSGPSPDPSFVKNHLAAQEASVRCWVAWTNADVEAFNHDLTAEVHDRLATRLAKARADADLPTVLGLPTHERLAGPRRDLPMGRLRLPAAAPNPLATIGQGHPGRPSWTPERYAEHSKEATAATPKPHTLAAVAPHFRALDGEIGVSPEWLGRLQRRFRSA